jgi:hypothetical protein
VGSPQSSVISPILFASFINDVCEQILNCKFHLYVDDLQLYTVDLGGDVDTLVCLVNEDLERTRRWYVDNSLVLNVSKTQAMLISRLAVVLLKSILLLLLGTLLFFSTW